MRRAAKVDNNHSAVVRALRDAGAQVQDLSAVGKGCPDLLCSFRGLNLLLEVKDGDKVPSARKLTADQVEWHSRWSGQLAIVTSPEAAVNAVVEAAKRAGVL